MPPKEIFHALLEQIRKKLPDTAKFCSDCGAQQQQDDAETVRMVQEAAAQNNLGFLYEHGKGIPQDYDMARQLFEKAAEQGHADAPLSLGYMYYYGDGVPQNYGMARKWYEKAAAQGHAAAQFNLGCMYY